MDITRLLTLTATITHVAQTGAVDTYGNPTEQTSTSTAAAELQQTARDEQDRDANIGEQTWLLLLAPTATIDATDRVTVSGVTYEVVGPPWLARNPRTGANSHIEATVRKAAA